MYCKKNENNRYNMTYNTKLDLGVKLVDFSILAFIEIILNEQDIPENVMPML